MRIKYTGLAIAELICRGFEAKYGVRPDTSSVTAFNDGDELELSEELFVIEVDAGTGLDDKLAALTAENAAIRESRDDAINRLTALQDELEEGEPDENYENVISAPDEDD